MPPDVAVVPDYRAIVEAQAELISLARPDGTLVYVNAAYGRHYGRPAEQMLGVNLYELIPEAERAVVRARIEQVMADGGVAQGENRITLPSGATRWMAWTNLRMRGADGSVLLHSVGRDISDRKAAEAALGESRAFLERTGRTAGVGGWQFDLRSLELIWSEQTRRIHEVDDSFVPTLDAAIGFYPADARPLIEAAVQRGMRDGEPWDLELPFVTAQGRQLWVRAVGEAEFEDGIAVRLVGAFQDITERCRTERALRDLTEILESSEDLVVQTDWRGEIGYLNPAARRALGLPTDTPLPPGLNFSQFNTPETNRLFAQTIVPAVKAHGVWLGDTTVVVAGGRILPVSHLVIAHRDESGRVVRYSAVMRDISEKVQSRAELLRQSATLHSVAEAIPAVVAVVGADQRYRFVNGAFERWVGSSRERILGSTVREVLGHADQERSQPWIDRALAGEAVNFEREYLVQGRPRHLSVTYVPLWTEDGRGDGFVGVLQDISAQRLEASRLLQLSQIDALTGLANRAGFEQALRSQLDAGGGPSLALLYIDLDRFKPVNDQHGHAVGDEVLRAFAQRLRGLVRPTDVVARLGGDEFTLLLIGVREQENAERVAAKVVEATRAPFEVGTLSLSIGASVGVAFGAAPGVTGEELLARADAMLYRAKNAGRGGHAAERT